MAPREGPTCLLTPVPTSPGEVSLVQKSCPGLLGSPPCTWTPTSEVSFMVHTSQGCPESECPYGEKVSHQPGLEPLRRKGQSLPQTGNQDTKSCGMEATTPHSTGLGSEKQNPLPQQPITQRKAWGRRQTSGGEGMLPPWFCSVGARSPQNTAALAGQPHHTGGPSNSRSQAFRDLV